MASAASYFERLGYVPDTTSVSMPDYMLDVAIKSSVEEVNQLVEEFRGWVRVGLGSVICWFERRPGSKEGW